MQISVPAQPISGEEPGGRRRGLFFAIVVCQAGEWLDLQLSLKVFSAEPATNYAKDIWQG